MAMHVFQVVFFRGHDDVLDCTAETVSLHDLTSIYILLVRSCKGGVNVVVQKLACRKFFKQVK